MSTLHLTNWSSRKLHGPGRKLSIMTRPRAWERGEGQVEFLCPHHRDLDAAKSGAIDIHEYRRRYMEPLIVAVASGVIGPGQLLFYPDNANARHVKSGDTLLCACSVANASKGLCHRVFASHALARAGWSIILDGRPFDTLTDDGAPTFKETP